MKKALSLIVLAFMLVSVVGMVSADTLIAGKIYDGRTGQITDVIGGAEVTVTCELGSSKSTQNTISGSDGQYSVTFTDTECNYNYTLTVSAVKGDLCGSNTGVIHDDAFMSWDLAIVNVPLVPEFGVFAGVLTIVSALGVFFLVRKK